MSLEPWYKTAKFSGKKRVLKPRTILNRVIRKLEGFSHSRFKRIGKEGWLVRVFRDYEDGVQRYVELTCLSGEGRSVRVKGVNIIGWAKHDVRDAAKSAGVEVRSICFG